jgi:hypothetical protein
MTTADGRSPRRGRRCSVIAARIRRVTGRRWPAEGGGSGFIFPPQPPADGIERVYVLVIEAASDVNRVAVDRGCAGNDIAGDVLPCHVPGSGVQRGHGVEIAAHVNQVIAYRGPGVGLGVVGGRPDRGAGPCVQRVDVMAVRSAVVVIVSRVDDAPDRYQALDYRAGRLEAPDPGGLQARGLQARTGQARALQLRAPQARRDLLGLALIARRHANPGGNSGPSYDGKGAPTGHLRPGTSGRAEAGLRWPDGDVDDRRHCGRGPPDTRPGDRLLQPPPVGEISRAGGRAGHRGRAGRGQAAWALMIWYRTIPVLAPLEVCEDRRSRELGTGRAPVLAPSTAQADRQTGQRWGTGKGSQHPRDHEGSPLKERPGLGPDALLPQGTSGLGPRSRPPSPSYGRSDASDTRW